MSSISIKDFMDKILVVCPHCQAMAIATANKLICSHCGFSKEQKLESKVQLTCTYCYAKLQNELSTADHRHKVLVCSNCLHIKPIRCKQCGDDLEKKISLKDGKKSRKIKIVCDNCGDINNREIIWSLGVADRPDDPYFGEPLWLQMNVSNKILWFYNFNHLAFIKKYIAAQLRESSTINNSLISRLPSWIKQAKHRTQLLKAIEKLENKK